MTAPRTISRRPQSRLSDDLRDTIIAFARTGKTAAEIHDLIQDAVSVGYVQVIISNARKTDASIPYATVAARCRARNRVAKLTLKCTLSISAMRVLGAAAMARGISAETLASCILEAIANDGIINAVLDDGSNA